MSAVLGAAHVLCAIGDGSEQVWASARAGIARIESSHVMDRNFEAIRMGLVPELALPPLPPPIEELPLPSRARRMLRLAAAPFKAVAAGAAAPVAVFLGLPDVSPDEAPWLKHVPAYLQAMTGVAVDRERSVIVPEGRAAALLALERALVALDSGAMQTVVVGGVDTYLDLRLLATLDAERRILGSRVMDGFIPGEGAAFYVLRRAEETASTGDGPRIVVHGAASTRDPGHRYGDAPAKGEGLAMALEQLRQRMQPPPSGPIATTFAGFNGENFDAKLWGVARMRHHDFFSGAMVIEHPADKYGDAGAATGAVLVALAAQALRTGTRSGPALVWAASDREPRACAVLSCAASE
jgi:3-oxoacyl-[acyl-carrier-protein] synthase-1